MQTNRMLPYLAAAAVVAAILIAVGAPLASLLPFALLLLCPLMMVVMMRGMSRSHGQDRSGQDAEHDPAPKTDQVRPAGPGR